MRYEDICRAPRAALSEVLDAAGLSLGEPAPSNLHAIGGSPDFRPTPLDRLRVDERWREDMPAAMQAQFERRAGAFDRRRGAAT